MKKNIPLYKSLKFKINLFVTTIILIIIVFSIYISNQNQKKLVRMKEDHLNQISVEIIDRRFKVSYEILETSLAQIIVNPLIIDAIDLGDVDLLSDLVLPSYDKLKEVGVDEFNFYRPDNSSLLNLYEHKDDQIFIRCDRTIIRDINSDPEHLPIRGIEECQDALYLRYIEPIYKNGQYIGSVELGMKVADRILDIFKNVSDGEWFIYSLREEGQRILEGTSVEDTYPLDINEELKRSLDKGEVFKTEETPYIIQMIPIANYKGEYKNYFKHIFDNSELINLQNQYTKRYIMYGALAAVFSIFLLWTAMTYLLSPLIYLEKKVRKLEQGSLVEPIEAKSNDEIGYLAGAMENMRQSLYQRELELKEQSYIDPLTGVYNRLYYNHSIDKIIEEEMFPTTIIMADIDGLKKINDKEGHARGDAYIIKCTEIMKSAMRDTDKLCRIGGDEFILLFPSTDQKTGERILSRVKKEIETYNKTLGKDETILSVSFGLDACKSASNCLEHTVASADRRMYKDKAKKKSKIK